MTQAIKETINTLLQNKVNFNFKINSNIATMFNCYSSLLRKYGKETISTEDISTFPKELVLLFKDFSYGQLARSYFLIENNNPTFVKEIILRGDANEQIAVLRTLSLLDNSSQYTNDVIHLCRTNITKVFQAVACNNPYPALHFDDASFFQMALKTIFVELDFDEIINLEQRSNKVFERMLYDLYQERTKAERPLPENVMNFINKKGIL